MWGQLAAMGLSALQEDSNRKAQGIQAAIDRQYQPWLGSNPAGDFQTQTEQGDVLTKGMGSVMAMQNEQARNKQQNELINSLLGGDGQGGMQGYDYVAPNKKKSQFDLLQTAGPMYA